MQLVMIRNHDFAAPLQYLTEPSGEAPRWCLWKVLQQDAAVGVMCCECRQTFLIAQGEKSTAARCGSASPPLPQHCTIGLLRVWYPGCPSPFECSFR